MNFLETIFKETLNWLDGLITAKGIEASGIKFLCLMILSVIISIILFLI